MITSIRTILVDDEPRGLTSMEKLLEMNCPDIAIVASCNNVDTAIEKITELDPDLIFLDIAMPVKNGFDLLKEIKEPRFEVIFITAYNQFTIEAFHFSATDYLVKPVDDELLINAVNRAKKRIAEKSGSKNIETLLHNLQQKQTPSKLKLCLPSMKGFQVAELNDILYAESSGNYTNFHFTNQHPICTSKPIHEYEELLADAGFVRIHKSCIVNLLHVKEYLRGDGGTVILSNGHEVEVARRKKDIFLSRMKEFYKF
ncbi:MAG TPA: LytTR family DNA-binding domain-containing protein [Chitinophagaceae bacterium]|jgi:two-component system LytT family response regulator|nr:LytTR family DNA-binding domain-containing protein [Chitinophagaceae bacterium]